MPPTTAFRRSPYPHPALRHCVHGCGNARHGWSHPHAYPPQRQPLRRTAHHRLHGHFSGRGRRSSKGFTAVLRKPSTCRPCNGLNRHATLSGEAPAPHRNPGPARRGGHAIREELEHLLGFSVRQGLDRVMGNLPLYVSLSCSISGASLPKPTPRSGGPAAGRYALHRASVHKLKGISGNVGATDLYTQLVELEQCLQGVPQKMSTTFLTPYTATLQRPRVSLRRQGRPSPRTPKPL